MLSANQKHLLDSVAAAPNSSTAALVAATNHTQNAVDKVLRRLYRKGLLDGQGKGRHRRWHVTDAGRRQLALDQERRTGSRRYKVLEETTIADLFQRDGLDGDMLVFVVVSEPQARNTDHALRLTAKENGRDWNGATKTLVPVSVRHWQPSPVTIEVKDAVTIG